MGKVLLGAALVVGVVVAIKALQGSGEHAPAPPTPPPPEDILPADAGVPGGTG